MITKTMRNILQALSYGNIEVDAARRLADLKKLDPMRIFFKKLDAEVYNGDYDIPIRLYFPSEEAMVKGVEKGHALPVLLFFHGGGWVTESVENYDRICARMSQATGQIVASVEYRLAPEYKFPIGLEDCYAAAKALYTNRFLLNTDPDKITVMGDSAGGNLAAAVSLMARDRKEFVPRRQILIYPAVNNDYSENSKYDSVRENGESYLLTRVKIEGYQELYLRNPEDKENPYYAPLLAEDLTDQPDTLILTAEFDPLRDEGEAYGERLRCAGNRVEVHRIKGALHGYFALGIKFFHVEESFKYMNRFLKGESERVGIGTVKVEKIR